MKPAELARSGTPGRRGDRALSLGPWFVPRFAPRLVQMHGLLRWSLCVLLVSGCAAPPAPAPSPPPPQGLADVLDRPAERALFDGMRAYDDGQYPLAESALRVALAGSLRSARDKAAAHKLLAFIFCTSNREMQCEAAFRSARESDTTFSLTRAESGHPLWGPVYRRVLRLP